MRLRVGENIKNMLGEDVPCDSVLGIGVKDANPDELFMLAAVEQRETVEAHRALTTKVWLNLVCSFLAYLILKAGEDHLVISLDRLRRLSSKIKLLVEIDREEQEVTFTAAKKEEIYDSEDTDRESGPSRARGGFAG